MSATAEKAATERAAAPAGPKPGTAMAAIVRVLDDADGPMTPKEVYAKIKQRRLAPGLKGKTPDQTVASQLAVAAKEGKHGIHRPEKGKFARKTDDLLA